MKTYTGINIQHPISKLIMSGKKTIETRTYAIPDHLVGSELLVIETPGPLGKFKARIVGTIVFRECFKYNSGSQFYMDIDRHFVTPTSPWRWEDTKPKWGWVIDHVNEFSEYFPAPKRKGIVYTKDLTI